MLLTPTWGGNTCFYLAASQRSREPPRCSSFHCCLYFRPLENQLFNGTHTLCRASTAQIKDCMQLALPKLLFQAKP
jgi:hypothetical protein